MNTPANGTNPSRTDTRRLRRQRLAELERHLDGLRAHLEAIGLRAEASAVRTDLGILKALQ